MEGTSFGGVVAFIFADLLIIPLLLSYAKYCGKRMAWFLFATFYATRAAAGYVIELIFGPLGLVPPGTRHADVGASGSAWNYTWLKIVFLILAAVLVWRFFTTGGRHMLAMMGGPPVGHDRSGQ